MEIDVVMEDDEHQEWLKQKAEQLKNLISTEKGTCPLHRDYGIDNSFMQFPGTEGESLFFMELLEQTEIYIPDIDIKEVECSFSLDGTVAARIVIQQSDSEEDEEEEDNEFR